MYQAFIVDSDKRRIAVQAAVDELLEYVGGPIPRLAVQSTGRTKTRATLREKLRRDPHTKLPSIRDVAGVRVVADCSLVEMDLGVRIIRRLIGTDGSLSKYGFTGEVRLINRLETPMHGYRALHLEVRLDGAPAEIQFRTQLQHVWAEFMELLGDRWGRELRYGLPIAEEEPLLLDIKKGVVGRMEQLSTLIARSEQNMQHLGVAYMDLDAMGENSAFDLSPETRKGLLETKLAAAPVIAELHSAVRESTSQLAKVLDLLDSITAKRETP